MCLLLTGCQSESLKISIERQLKEYPESRVLDIYKCFCQDNLGPEHLIPNKEAAQNYLMSELAAYRHDLDSALYEKPTLRYFSVGDEGNYVRVDLSVILDSMINTENYLDAFVRSANEGVHRSPEEWKQKWTEIADCIRENFSDIPNASQDLAWIDSIMTGDDLIIHHSEAFGKAYHPHYRIISKDIFEAEILPLIQNKKVAPATEVNDVNNMTEQETTYFPAIDRYLVDEIGKHYSKGEHCVPFHHIVAVDERNAEDILIWGDFWVFNYNQVGDTLKCVSGGSHPGLMHVAQTENGFKVTAFEQVEDGSRFLPTAKKIFGDKFEAFQVINSDEKSREVLRAEVLGNYVKEQGLSVTMYQDYGWPAKRIGL